MENVVCKQNSVICSSCVYMTSIFASYNSTLRFYLNFFSRTQPEKLFQEEEKEEEEYPDEPVWKKQKVWLQVCDYMCMITCVIWKIASVWYHVYNYICNVEHR